VWNVLAERPVHMRSDMDEQVPPNGPERCDHIPEVPGNCSVPELKTCCWRVAGASILQVRSFILILLPFVPPRDHL
jgi:hypothetical protein